MENGIEIVGEAGDGVEAAALTQLLQPDVVLMDVEMPRMGGIESTRTIKRLAPSTRVLVLSVYEGPQADAVEAGADCFLLKDCGRSILAAAIRRAGDNGRSQSSIPAGETGAANNVRGTSSVLT